MTDGSTDEEVLGCLRLTWIMNLVPLLVSLSAHLLWTSKITFFILMIFIILGAFWTVVIYIGSSVIEKIIKEQENDR